MVTLTATPRQAPATSWKRAAALSTTDCLAGAGIRPVQGHSAGLAMKTLKIIDRLLRQIVERSLRRVPRLRGAGAHPLFEVPDDQEVRVCLRVFGTAAFVAAVAVADATARTVRVNEKITLATKTLVKIGSNKTILGVGAGSGFTGGGLAVDKSSNVIIRNLAISKVVGTDAIQIQRATSSTTTTRSPSSATVTATPPRTPGSCTSPTATTGSRTSTRGCPACGSAPGTPMTTISTPWPIPPCIRG